MDADTNMLAGQVEGPTPLEVLQIGLNPDTFQAMRAIFHGFKQWFQAMENNYLTTQNFQNAITTAFTHTHLMINAPMAAPPPSSASHTNPPRTIIQPVCGKSNENITAWISLAEDVFVTGQVQKNQWTGCCSVFS